jgi:hypothetical protein
MVDLNSDTGSLIDSPRSLSSTAMAKPYLVTSANQSLFLSFRDRGLERKFVADHSSKARTHDLQVGSSSSAQQQCPAPVQFSALAARWLLSCSRALPYMCIVGYSRSTGTRPAAVVLCMLWGLLQSLLQLLLCAVHSQLPCSLLMLLYRLDLLQLYFFW